MIRDLVEIGIAFVLFLAASGIGAGIGAVRERNRKAPKGKPPNLTCGCGHSLAVHDGLTTCQRRESRNVGTTKSGRVTYELLQCDCKQYTGELPADWYLRNGLPDLPDREEKP